MKKFIYICVILFLSISSLDAYSKRIIASSYTSERTAQKSFKKFQNSSVYTELKSLSKEYAFDILMRSAGGGKYYIVVMEPFFDKKICQKSLKIVRKYYKNAYLNKYKKTKEKPKLIKKEKLIKKKVLKQEKEVVKKEVTKKEVTKKTLKLEKVVKVEKKTKPKKQKEVPSSFEFVSYLMYIVILLVLLVLVYYFRKFKKIYDEY